MKHRTHTRARRVKLLLGLMAALLIVPATAAAKPTVLYDQTDHLGTGTANDLAPNFSPSNDFGDSADMTADDFKVPARRAWRIQQVNVQGAYQGSPVHKVNVFIFRNAKGKPGKQVFSKSLIKASNGPNYRINVKGAPKLKPGRYWISVQQQAASGNYWSWATRTARSGFLAQWNPTMGSPPCAGNAWSPRRVCWTGTDPDQIFALRGVQTVKTMKHKKPPIVCGKSQSAQASCVSPQ